MKKLGSPHPGERLLRSRGNSRSLNAAEQAIFAAFDAGDYENASVPRIYDYTPRRSVAVADELPDNVIRFTMLRSSRRKA
jgi:hypothetical protein